MSLLVVGSVALDAVETPFGKAERVLGGAASYFSVAASFFAPVNLVAVVGHDFGDREHVLLTGSRPLAPSLGDLVGRPRDEYLIPLLGGLQNFFDNTSCSIVLSSVRSATNLFRRAFSSCNCFNSRT